jgi:hypothetical protein
MYSRESAIFLSVPLSPIAETEVDPARPKPRGTVIYPTPRSPASTSVRSRDNRWCRPACTTGTVKLSRPCPTRRQAEGRPDVKQVNTPSTRQKTVTHEQSLPIRQREGPCVSPREGAGESQSTIDSLLWTGDNPVLCAGFPGLRHPPTLSGSGGRAPLRRLGGIQLAAHIFSRRVSSGDRNSGHRFGIGCSIRERRAARRISRPAVRSTFQSATIQPGGTDPICSREHPSHDQGRRPGTTGTGAVSRRVLRRLLSSPRDGSHET